MLNKNYQKLHIAAITIVSEMPTRTALVYCAVIPLEIMENATKISKGNHLLNFEKIYVCAPLVLDDIGVSLCHNVKNEGVHL